jgi:hypothetical protein
LVRGGVEALRALGKWAEARGHPYRPAKRIRRKV